MIVVEKLVKPRRYVLTVLKWTVLSAVIGVVGGLLGAAFHFVLEVVTNFRELNNWVIFLLPAGGLAIVGIYRLFHLQGNRGTNEVIESVLTGNTVSPLVAPTVFVSSAITHLLGGSAGREGAALQLGGSAATWFSKVFKLKKEENTVMFICGMASVFSGLFGTPLTACLFTLEFESVGTVFSPALLPCFISAFIASKISVFLGVYPVIAIQNKVIPFSFSNTWKVVLLAILVSFLGILMCYTFHKAETLAQKWIKNPYFRIVTGAVIIVALTFLVGDQRFSGAGMNMAVDAINGNVNWYSFILKMLFTAITLAVGFKGGEIVPTFCIGATFGCITGTVLGLDPQFAATLGLIGLFCAVTNSPLTSLILSIEMFGTANLYTFALVCVITFVLSGNSSLYTAQVTEFSKFSFKRKKFDLNR